MKPIDKDIIEIKETLIKIESDLKYHIKRTDLLESFMKNQIKFLLAVVISITIGLLGKSAFAADIDADLEKIQKEVKCQIVVF